MNEFTTPLIQVCWDSFAGRTFLSGEVSSAFFYFVIQFIGHTFSLCLKTVLHGNIFSSEIIFYYLKFTYINKSRV